MVNGGCDSATIARQLSLAERCSRGVPWDGWGGGRLAAIVLISVIRSGSPGGSQGSQSPLQAVDQLAQRGEAICTPRTPLV
jgi:hypothetical protein